MAGVDGTMRRRLADSPAHGWARLKSGTLRNVAALAGVGARRRAAGLGCWWAVLNHHAAWQTRRALDALVDTIAQGQPLHGRAR